MKFPKIINLINNCLKKSSFFYIGIHEGSKIFRDNFDRLYCYYKEDEIKDILESMNFKILKILKKSSKSFTGEKIKIMNIFCQKVS